MQPFQRQLLLKLRWATIMSLLLVGVLLTPQSLLLLLLLTERRILFPGGWLVAERPAVRNLMRVHAMVLRLRMRQSLLVVYIARLELQAVAAGLQLMVVVCGSSGSIMLCLQLCVLHLCERTTGP